MRKVYELALLNQNDLFSATMSCTHAKNTARPCTCRGAPETMNRLPSLTAVRYFAVAAHWLSFTVAARELHVTQGAVSRMVQSLESDLGVQLFSRNGRWISLTPAGKVYYEKVSQGLRQIEAAGTLVRKSTEEDALSIVVNEGFATLWLVPKLPEFRSQHPDILVNLLGSDPDSAGEPAALAIRYGTPPWPGCVATRLPVSTTLGVVCSPQLQQLTRLRRPDDLVGRPLLAYTGGKRDYWKEYFEKLDLAVPDMAQSPRFPQLLTLREAALSGIGFALVPLFLVESELEAGRLVRALPQTVEPDHGYYVTHPKGADLDERVHAFKKWLIARSKAAPKRGENG
ncbi:LysR substrate-binding domain-containing protein [Cupriavidus oxalaticus]|uniref:LysR substrate-binding domain-containing protein n=1 Tax=Cupriavidus oxalaticus TaxID=96344 RepID=UPI00317B6B93